jgi:resuscitation-promoting factor RpfB
MKNRSIVAALLVLLMAGLTAFGLTFRRVRIEADGTTRTVLTHGHTVSVALRDAGITLGMNDAVDPPAEAALQSGMLIRLLRGRTIQVTSTAGTFEVMAREGSTVIPANLLLEAGLHLVPGDAVLVDGVVTDPDAPLPTIPGRVSLAAKQEVEILRDGVRELHAAAGPTVGEALWQLGIIVRPGDSVDPPAGAALGDPGTTTIVVRSARDYRVAVDGQSLSVRSAAPTVGEILTQAGVALTNLDFSRPADDQPAPVDGAITVVRVREDFIREQSPIPFGEQRQYLPEVDLAVKQLVSAGVYGVKESTVRVRFEDGVEISRTAEGERVAVPPVDQVMGYGTKVTIRSVSTPDGTFDYWHSITVYGSAYWPCGSAGEPGRCYPHTASGKDVDLGIIAVVKAWYNVMQGWPVYVERYGPAHIEDVGRNVTSTYWIDVAFPDYETFVALGGSGPKTTTLYFRTPVPGEDAIRFVASLPLR